MSGERNAMDCMAFREALSARLDGEGLPVPERDLERHLAGCSECRDWEHRAVELSRWLRVRPIVPIPDVRIAPPVGWPRRLLAGVAVCQLLLGLAQVAGIGHAHHGGESMSTHLFNESTAWNLALGLGLLVSAVRTRTAAGLVPVLAAFLLVLTGFSVLDLVHGAVPVSRLLSHVFLVAGLVLLLLVQRGERRWSPREVLGDHWATTSGPPAEPARRHVGHRHLRPVNYRRAA
ncbi:membrane protein [Saccharopolyspora subtropica]|uniref:Membrane protein n=1 Tax=Saccharopolyspora thermophila TaxID=89367 RepID=A0A917N7B4_9PSEU|nr:zf-HC2 domain-containing protein [Saccharopolyspora subtropica]GGI74096.1 membrane protein [Saccharopolyspora subtropica]